MVRRRRHNPGQNAGNQGSHHSSAAVDHQRIWLRPRPAHASPNNTNPDYGDQAVVGRVFDLLDNGDEVYVDAQGNEQEVLRKPARDDLESLAYKVLDNDMRIKNLEVAHVDACDKMNAWKAQLIEAGLELVDVEDTATKQRKADNKIKALKAMQLKKDDLSNVDVNQSVNITSNNDNGDDAGPTTRNEQVKAQPAEETELSMSDKVTKRKGEDDLVETDAKRIKVTDTAASPASNDTFDIKKQSIAKADASHAAPIAQKAGTATLFSNMRMSNQGVNKSAINSTTTASLKNSSLLSADGETPGDEDEDNAGEEW